MYEIFIRSIASFPSLSHRLIEYMKKNRKNNHIFFFFFIRITAVATIRAIIAADKRITV